MIRNLFLSHLVIWGLFGCNKPATPTTAESGEGAAEGTKSEEGGETIAEPTMIGGAFLVCAKDESLPQKQDHIAAGCRIQDQDQNPLKLPEGVSSQLTVFDPFNTPLAADAIQAAPVGTKWDWQVSVSVFDAWTNESLVKFVKEAQEVGSSTTEIDLRQAGSSEIASVTLGKIYDYGLGDVPSSCKVEAGNSRINAGNTMVVPFYNEKPLVRIAITIKDFCIGGAGDLETRVALKKGNKTIYSASINSVTEAVYIPGTSVEVGIYHLVFESVKAGIQINKIKFISQNSDDLKIGNPVFNIADAPIDQGVTPTDFVGEESGNIFATSTNN